MGISFFLFLYVIPDGHGHRALHCTSKGPEIVLTSFSQFTSFALTTVTV